MKIIIEPSSGFCFGVRNAVAMAGEVLDSGKSLYSLGELVHNREELDRLKEKGLKVVSRSDFPSLAGSVVLVRAHGEPPETFAEARNYGITLLDATCPVVLKLQKRIHKSHTADENTQVVIYGKEGHAEVVGLAGQTGYKALVVSTSKDLENIDFSKPVEIYSQTTMSHEGFERIVAEIRQRMAEKENGQLIVHDTICGQVAGRAPLITKFALEHDVMIFVSGRNSSNGNYLYNVCRQANPRSYFISGTPEIDPEWFSGVESVGISGATSTPVRQLEEVASYILNLLHP